MHVDGGSNIHICTNKDLIIDYKVIMSSVQQVSGTSIKSEGIGSLLVSFGKDPNIIKLYPVHYIPNNPQNTFSPCALKHYNKCIKVNVNTLKSLSITFPNGKSASIPTEHEYIN